MSTPAGTQPVPVPVHLTSIGVGVQLGQPPPAAGAVRTRFLTETVDDANPVRPLLPADDARECAWLQATGGDVYLCASESDATQATPAGSVLPSANTGPWPARGQGAVWAAQATSGDSCVISVTADYRQ
ncbi:MAG: hypothetical protein ACRDND_11960 [Streptosporangiaceae bacterium]